jgi:Domain of unknown function (DUF4390)
MHCCKKHRSFDGFARTTTTLLGGGGRALRRIMVMVGLAMALAAAAWANDDETEPVQASLMRNGDGLFLSARLNLSLSEAVEDALSKGIPLLFVWQAEVVQPRWYWWDKDIASATRAVRLAYQPLTRHWRLSVGEDGSTSRFALHQNFASLSEAMRSVLRLNEWKLSSPARLSNDSGQFVRLSFRLDLSQLPRPFQMGVVNEPDWGMGFDKVLPLPALNETLRYGKGP